MSPGGKISFLIRREEKCHGDTYIKRRNSHVTTEADTGVMQLQTQSSEDCGQPPNYQNCEKRQRNITQAGNDKGSPPSPLPGASEGA